jgi:hypothetical protein
MPKIILAAVTGLVLAAAPAQAQLARTFVSAANGDDANDCNRLTPCRTFQAAHDKTFAQGEITVLDPGGYGAVTITKALSIINDGVGEAGVLVSGGTTGITINAPASAAVSLRGLTVQGIGFGGGSGLRFNSGAALTMTNCVVRNLTGDAVGFFPTGASNLAMANTLVADNGGSGINVKTVATSNVKATFSRVEVYNNLDSGFAFVAQPGGLINATVEDSLAVGNLAGVLTGAAAGHATSITVVRSVLAHNVGAGVFASGAAVNNAILRVSQSVIVANGAAKTGDGVQTFDDNYVFDNTTGNDFTTPRIAKK